MNNRLNWQPPAFDKPDRPATNRRPRTPRSKGNPFPAPAESLNRLTESHQPTEARLVLTPGADGNEFREAFAEVWEKIPGADPPRPVNREGNDA